MGYGHCRDRNSTGMGFVLKGHNWIHENMEGHVARSTRLNSGTADSCLLLQHRHAAMVRPGHGTGQTEKGERDE
jgi:hypothetical protein